MSTSQDFELEDTHAASTKPPSVARTKKKPPAHRLNYTGRTGPIYKIVILDLLLRIVTLGIYAFWGRTRLRRYLVAHHNVADDSFEYTGTGGELFKGFLKALPVLIVVVGPLAFIEEAPILGLFYIPFIYCIGIAIYGATRYRYSRTRWRGIQGYLGGSTLGYANMAFGRLILNILTLGFAKPYSDIAKHRYIMNNTCFGTIKANYDGNARNIYGAYIKFLIATPIFALAPFFLIMVLFKGANIESLKSISAFMSIPALLMALFGILLAHGFYKAALIREKMRGLKVGNLKFLNTVTPMALVKHQMMNLLLLALTLGLAFPYIIHRNTRFFARHVYIIGDLNSFVAQQAEHEDMTSGEGLDAAFDLDTGFF